MKHLACIMDGNRRWAKQHGWVPWSGHKEGVLAAQRVVDFCLAKGISFLSLYTFSVENFRRSEQEQHYMFKMLVNESSKSLDNWIKKGVRVRFIGDLSLFPEDVQQACARLEKETAAQTKLQVNLLFGYGSRQELVFCMQQVGKKLLKGELALEDISPQILEQHLWTEGIPGPDLVIRTGGAQRLSNFLLYQVAYSELYFLECFWPEINNTHLEKAVEYFNQCKRNFGT